MADDPLDDADFERVRQVLATARSKRAPAARTTMTQHEFNKGLGELIGRIIGEQRNQIDAEIATLRRRLDLLEGRKSDRPILRSRLPARR